MDEPLRLNVMESTSNGGGVCMKWLLNDRKTTWWPHIYEKDGDGMDVAYIRVPDDEPKKHAQSEKIAQRFAACWNACAPFEDPQDAVSTILWALKRIAAGDESPASDLAHTVLAKVGVTL